MRDQEGLDRVRQRDYPWASDDQWECIHLVADLVGGFHHLEGKIKDFGLTGVRTSLYSDVSTFDSDRLTRLVFLAHDRCIRASVVSSGPRRIGIELFKRHAREGSTSKRHPTIEQALALWRKSHPETDNQTAQSEQEEGK